jgi:hypothetical protein
VRTSLTDFFYSSFKSIKSITLIFGDHVGLVDALYDVCPALFNFGDFDASLLRKLVYYAFHVDLIDFV